MAQSDHYYPYDLPGLVWNDSLAEAVVVVQTDRGMGSGVLVSDNAVLTARHVVSKGENERLPTRVTFFSRPGLASASIAVSDIWLRNPYGTPGNILDDLALLRLLHPVDIATPIKPWWSAGAPRFADGRVLIAGYSSYPYPTGPKWRRWVSTDARRASGAEPMQLLYAIGKPIEHGDSGGPWLSVGPHGEPVVVGITSRIYYLGGITDVGISLDPAVGRDEIDSRIRDWATPTSVYRTPDPPPDLQDVQPVPIPATPPPSQLDPHEEAKRLFFMGEDAYMRNDFSLALILFSSSYEFEQQPDVLYNIGICQIQLGLIDEAAETFLRYVNLEGNLMVEGECADFDNLWSELRLASGNRLKFSYDNSQCTVREIPPAVPTRETSSSLLPVAAGILAGLGVAAFVLRGG